MSEVQLRPVGNRQTVSASPSHNTLAHKTIPHHVNH